MAQVKHLNGYKSAHFMDGDTLKIVCHSTVIVAAGPDQIVLNTGGWNSRKTRDDMNRAANQFNLGYRVFQKDFGWFVQMSRDGAVFPFESQSITLSRY